MPEIDVSEDTLERLDAHREAGESYEELVQDLLSVYEQTGAFTDEGL
jgi:hypothetical protein